MAAAHVENQRLGFAAERCYSKPRRIRGALYALCQAVWRTSAASAELGRLPVNSCCRRVLARPPLTSARPYSIYTDHRRRLENRAPLPLGISIFTKYCLLFRIAHLLGFVHVNDMQNSCA